MHLRQRRSTHLRKPTRSSITSGSFQQPTSKRSGLPALPVKDRSRRGETLTKSQNPNRVILSGASAFALA